MRLLQRPPQLGLHDVDQLGTIRVGGVGALRQKLQRRLRELRSGGDLTKTGLLERERGERERERGLGLSVSRRGIGQRRLQTLRVGRQRAQRRPQAAASGSERARR